jgi:aspartate kinase
MAETLQRITPTLKQEDLKAANFVIEAVTENEKIKVSVLIAEEYVELAVRALHSAYELDAA